MSGPAAGDGRVPARVTDTADAPVVSVVAVHGNGGGAHRFSLVAPQMPSGTQLVTVTLPGFAAEPVDPSLQTVEDYARTLGELVASVPRPRVVLGHGIGGSIALQLAQQPLPELDGLILHAPVGAHLDTRWFPWLMGWPGLRYLAQRGIASRWLRPLLRRLMFSEAVPPAYVDRFFDEYGTCTVFGQMFDTITPEWFARLRPVRLPAALLWGMAERVLPADQLNAFKVLLPEAIVLQVPGWGHFPMAEAPRSYADEIATLARELVRRSDESRSQPRPSASASPIPPDGDAGGVTTADRAAHTSNPAPERAGA